MIFPKYTQKISNNLAEGGKVSRGVKGKPSSLKGKKHTKDRIEKNRQSQIERYRKSPYPEHLKEYMRDIMSDRKIDWGDKISKSKMGHSVSEQTKEKIKKSLKGKNNKKIYWNFEKCKKTALDFSGRTEFRKNFPGAYASCRKNGWLDIVCEHMK